MDAPPAFLIIAAAAVSAWIWWHRRIRRRPLPDDLYHRFAQLPRRARDRFLRDRRWRCRCRCGAYGIPWVDRMMIREDHGPFGPRTHDRWNCDYDIYP